MNLLNLQLLGIYDVNEKKNLICNENYYIFRDNLINLCFNCFLFDFDYQYMNMNELKNLIENLCIYIILKSGCFCMF